MSEKMEDGGPAFPVHGGYSGDDPRNQILGGGLSLRDWFAGQALQSVMMLCHRDTLRGETLEQHFAKRAYDIADAMLTARRKSTGQ